MTSSLSSNPFERQACLPFFNYDGQAKDNKNIPNQLPKKNHHDTSKPEMKQIEDLLASEMHRLTVQQRAEAFDDVHCVGEELEETPEMIQKSLADFEEAVQKEQNPIYEMAMNQNRSYVEDPIFRLKFLRAKLYDVGEAVRNMFIFLQVKAKYFGHDKIARDISLDDLHEEEKKLMLSGLFHIQDGRDPKGRVIVHLFGKMLSRCSADVLVRSAALFLLFKKP
mmetsp:Transcript_1713/g.3719  ORF Transcript_1713/g.3719 Transcript_1713/m.3719 type:complete len:223 (-) Transcript_1713:961-1629(-)